MNYDIQCYLQKDDGTSAAINTKSLCQGMYVLEAKGLADYGKAKNIVTESYAEGDGLRAYIPSDGVIKREATDVSLKLLFLDEGGDGRYQQYDTFIAYMKSNIVFYWDSVRKRKARLLFVEKSSPEEHFKGSLPYIEATVKFKNVDGYSEQLGRWSYSWSGLVCVKVDGLQNGQARHPKLNVALGSVSIDFDIMEAFGTYDAIDTTDLANMSDSDYLSRLSSFCNYVYSYMSSSGYIDFADDLISITDGAYGSSALCPVESPGGGGGGEPQDS